MKIAITGGTGFVGGKLVEELQSKGHEIFILTRGEAKIENNIRYIKWLGDEKPEQHLEGIEAIINLAGVSLNSGRWDAQRKDAIFSSRMEATQEVIRIIKALSSPPKVLVNASAIGIYPASESNVYTESSTHYSDDFLGHTVQQWEYNAKQAEELGVRVCFSRFGVILGKDAGALPSIVLPYQLYVGGTVGSGKQWISWIHIEDVVRGIVFLLETEEIEGPVNFATPNAKRMKQFGKIVGHSLNRPHWLPVPAVALKLALGEKSQLVLEGQYVEPRKLLYHGFEFKHCSLKETIIDLYNQ